MAESRFSGRAVALAVLAAVAVHAVAYDHTLVATTTYLGVLVGASVAAWIGAERAPAGRRTVPRLIATGLTLTALGDVVWSVLDLTGAPTDVSIADPAWFASYVFLCAALLVMLDRDEERGPVDLDFLVDAMTIVVVSGLILWSTSIRSIVTDGSVSPYVRAVWAAYPVADAVLLALVVRVLMSRSTRVTIDPWFAVGVCLWLAADLAYLQAPEGDALSVVMDSAWMVAPVLVARAAWRGRPSAPVEPDHSTHESRVAQLMVAVGTLLVPVGIESVNALRGEPRQPFLLLTGTAALIILAFVRTARLISSEAEARRALEEARDAAYEASRAKSMFVANMSHEIRTPLTTVLAAEEMLEDTSLDELQVTLVAKMHRSGQMLKTLVDRILDFSRLEAGQLVLTPTPFDLHALVADVAEVYRPRAAQGGIAFAYHLDRRVAQDAVGDPGRLFQVLTNLLDNALKFTHQGSVTLTVRPSSTGDDIEFVVADTGIGIPAEAHRSVFESFTQVDGSATRLYGGSGLGLAISQELAQLMGGSITLQSQVGTGSTFVVSIPLTGATTDGSTLGA